ncbi:MobF family relaxase [Mucilaginibacter phenanthrenivorans]|uniref:MobF family relaxase n=1 Tax=Mucilaginibacter phenanthrenivorans TaxID=1234842 RepID=UPI002157286E|nr:MobF family relaxase [Mucilaginibacter phenanthrenivorans]
MIQSSNAAHAKSYFSDALQKSDYYTSDQELPGKFFGSLAGRIGLQQEATKESFFALCENINPVTGKDLTPRNAENRTTGYDINFHCPKSLSIVHSLSPDEHILKAFQASVYETMLDIESDAKTRVRKRYAYEDRETDELLWAEFIHQTARPVDGYLPDPHLHAHCFVFNATFDKKENRTKAGQFRDINRDMPYYQARFHKRLADKLTDLGYSIRRTDKSFEIEGVPQKVIDLFSKRTNEIGQAAREKGITDAKTLSELGAKTRSKKQKGLGMAELKAAWRKQIAENITYEPGEENTPIRHAPQREPDKTTAPDCVDYAIKHSFERTSVMADRRILATAYRHSLGKRSVSIENISDSFKSDSRIIRVKDKYKILCTTKAVLAEEQQMVNLARQGQGKFQPLYHQPPALSSKLNDQQTLAISHVLTTPHQVSIIRGAAGTGKTTVMTEARKHIEAADKQLFVVAPTAQASRGVLVEEGFENATTVANLLQNKELQEQLKHKVLWVDEAGLLGTTDMTALLSLAKIQNARIILGGDTRQHSAVVRGDALRILNTVAGIKTAEISKIHRQKNVHYRAAVEDLSKGDVNSAFIKLSSIGAIRNIDPLKPNESLIANYMGAIKKGKSALIVSPTHQQGKAVTDEIRQKLRSLRMLGKKEIKANKLENLNLTEAQKSDWRNFKPGEIIQFNQNMAQIKRGSIWVVREVSGKAVLIGNDAGKTLSLPQTQPVFDVYKQSEIELSIGDKVRITRNALDHQNKRLNNGQHLEVAEINKSGKVVLLNTASKTHYLLNKDFGHIDHAYCTTSHSAQGKTVDEVFISQPSSTFTATDAKQFYVSVSRGRDAATIYTDDRVALLEYASEIGDRQSALELVKSGKSHMDYVQQAERENYIPKNAQTITKKTLNLTTRLAKEDYEPEL